MLCAPAIQFRVHRAEDRAAPSGDVVASVRGVLDLPDDELDYASAKIAFDSLIDPEFDRGAGRLENIREKGCHWSGMGSY